MGVPGSANPLLLRSAGVTQYQVSRSLRFNASDSAYLSRTPASAGNRKTWTWAGWVKRSRTGEFNYLFDVSGTGVREAPIRFDDTDSITVSNINDPYTGVQYELKTSAVYRDLSAWYHIVVALDTTQASSSDRLKLYVNGERVTALATATYPAQNTDYGINSNVAHYIGRYTFSPGRYLNGYLADIHFIDGQALTPSSFTEVSATTGQLVPKAYTGAYGTNGFKLTFSDNSATTATTLGKDSAGSNNWTPNNFSVTAGAGNDSLVDTPTSYGTDTGAGGEVRGNYATLNALHGTGTLSNGNLDFTSSANPHKRAGTIGVATGKWYYEAVMTAQVAIYQGVGVGNQNYISAAGGIGGSADSWGILSESATNGYSYHNNSAGSDYGTINVNDVMMVAFDVDAGKIWFGVNGTWFNSGVPASGTGAIYTNLSGTLFPAISSGSGGTLICNFGQRSWAYQAPAGFKALCDTNLPSPQIAKPNTVMDVVTYTGTGASRSITGLGFSPDLVWMKCRSFTHAHQLYDTVRGTNKALYSNLTDSEFTDTDALTAFNSDGFTLGAEAGINESSRTYAAWTWDAGSSTVTNTQGSITSSVRANASAGFSIVTYTGNGSTATVGHGLGVAPHFTIVKNRSSSTWDWNSYHISLTSASYVISLNTTAGQRLESTTWNATAPTSTVFSVGSNQSNNNGSNYVAYCWAPVTGYSSFGSYTGNGSADGPFVFCNFRPRWVLIKYSSGVQDWILWDAARTPYNAVTSYLLPSKSDAEDSSSSWLDFTSNGFKIRQTNSAVNTNTGTYIYAAFAENPFQYARAR